MGDSVYALDVDDLNGDGDPDVVAATYLDNSVYWFENTATGWTRHTIDTGLGLSNTFQAYIANVADDPYMDVVVAGYTNILLFDNTNGLGTAWNKVTISSSSSVGRYSIKLVDVDGDGDLDVVDGQRTSNSIMWHRNDRSAVWTASAVATSPTVLSVFGVDAGDMDGDTDTDIVAALNGANTVKLFTNDFGSGLQWTASDLVSVSTPTGVAIADYTGDGILDIAVAVTPPDNPLWLRNNNYAGWSILPLLPCFGANYMISTGNFDNNAADDLVCRNTVVPSTALSYAPNSILNTPPSFPAFPLTSYNVSLDVRTVTNAPAPPMAQSNVNALVSFILSSPSSNPSPLPLVVADGVPTALLPLPQLSLYTLAINVSSVPIPSSPITIDRRLYASNSTLFPPTAPPLVGSTASLSLSLRGLSSSIMSVPPSYLYQNELTLTLSREYTSVPSTALPPPSRAVSPSSPATLDLSFPLDRLALYTLTASLHDGPVASSPYTIDRRVYAEHSSIDVTLTNNTYAVPFNTQQQLLIRLRGKQGVAHSVTPQFDYSRHLSVSIVLGSNSVPAVLSHAPSGADGDVLVTFQSPEAESFTFSATVDGLHISQSPFTLDFLLQCPPGTRIGATTCDDCPIGTYSEVFSRDTSSSCQLCAPGMTTSNPRSTSFLNCTCPPGSWFGSVTRTPTQVCQVCPPGGLCPGGLEYPVAAPGFFPVTPNAYDYVSCTRQGCIGRGQCEKGYIGYMCATCAPSYYSRSESECAPCPSGSTTRLALAIVLLCLIALAAGVFIAWTTVSVANTPASSTGQGKITAFRVRTTPVSISMVLVAFQCTGILARANFKWTSSSRAVLTLFSLFNIDSQAVAAECSLSSFHTTYAISVVIPFALIVAVMGVVLALRACHRMFSFLSGLENISIRTLIDSVLFTMAPLLYIPMAQACFVLFDCSRLPNGRFVLDADSGVECFDSSWWSVFPLGFVAVVGFVMGVPLYFGTTIWVRSHQLFDPSVVARFGSLYRNFRRDYYWGEIANLGKRLSIVLIATFFSRHQLVQIGLLTALLVVSGFFVATRRPYFVPSYNALEVRLSSVLLAVVFLGSASYAERSSSSTNTFLLVATILVASTLLIVALHAIVADIMSIRQERKSAFYSAGQRQQNLVAIISSELKDVEAGPDLLHAAGEFLAILDNTVRDSQSSRQRTTPAAIPLDDLDLVET